MLRCRLLMVTAICLSLTACFDAGPPADFHPEASAQPDPGNPQCPTLDGSYDLAGNPLGRAITDRAPPDSHGLPILLTFKRGATSTEAWWVVPRERLLEWAAAEREHHPENYARWRSLVLRGKLAGKLSYDHDAFLAAVTELGPPAPVYAGIVRYACEQNWMRTRVQPTSDRADDEGGSRETEIWLARDRSGDLLVKTLVYRLRSFHIWGDASHDIRTSSRTSWSRVPAQPFAPADPLTDADLPAAPEAEFAESRAGPTTCNDAAARVSDLSSFILANSPAGVALAFLAPLEDAPKTPTKPCRDPILELHFSGDSPAVLASVGAILLRSNLVRSVSVLTGNDDQPRLRKLRVVLK